MKGQNAAGVTTRIASVRAYIVGGLEVRGATADHCPETLPK